MPNSKTSTRESASTEETEGESLPFSEPAECDEEYSYT